MRKIIAYFIALILLSIPASYASSHGHHHHSGCAHRGYYHGGTSSSTPIYLIGKDYKKQEEKFANCDKHYMIVETFVNYYSDGTRRIFKNCTICNSDGTILQTDCQSVKHIMFRQNHYFIIRKLKYYYIMDSSGEIITERAYTGMEELAPNRLLVRFDKKYGIIDLQENIIARIKYKDITKCGNDVYITKLNGYYGLMDIDGKTLVQNDCERVKLMYDTIMLKRYGKYGLANKNGKIIVPIENDKIKKLEEYIVVRKENKSILLDSTGKEINGLSYKKFKMERNKLFGLTKDSGWVEINQDL